MFLLVYIANGYFLVMIAVNGLGGGGLNCLQCQVTTQGPEQNKITTTECIFLNTTFCWSPVGWIHRMIMQFGQSLGSIGC